MNTTDNGGMENVDSHNTALDDIEQSSTKHNDMSLGMKIFGILEMLGGALSVLVVILGLVIVFFVSKRLSNSQQTLAGIWTFNAIMYSVIAVVLLWMGIATFKCRRWARALTEANAWFALCMGCAMILFLPFSTNEMLNTLKENPNMLFGNITMITVLSTIFSVFRDIVVPLIFLLFFRSPNTKRTCEIKDPKERWTDRVPMKVLVLIIAIFYSILGASGSIFIGGIIPVFGQFLTGNTSIVLLVLTIAFLALAIRYVYNMKMSGWWMTMIIILVYYPSAFVTFLKSDMRDVFEAIQFTKTMLDYIDLKEVPSMASVAWSVPLVMILSIAYMIWIRRCFTPEYRESFLLEKTVQEQDDGEQTES